MPERPASPLAAGTSRLSGALDANPTLARLLQRLHASRERFEVIGPLLPEALRGEVRPGSLDEDGSWTLLVPHGAAASKLRQLVPELQQALRARGLDSDPVRVRVRAR
jgi:hypothetical protein